MLILGTLISALRYNLDEAEREYTVLLINLTHTNPIVVVGLEIFIGHDLAVAVLIYTDRITAVVC